MEFANFGWIGLIFYLFVSKFHHFRIYSLNLQRAYQMNVDNSYTCHIQISDNGVNMSYFTYNMILLSKLFPTKMYPMYTIIYHLSFLIIVKTVCIIIYWLYSQWRNIPTSSTPTTADQENTVNITETLTTVSKQLSSCVKTLITDEDSEDVA